MVKTKEVKWPKSLGVGYNERGNVLFHSKYVFMKNLYLLLLLFLISSCDYTYIRNIKITSYGITDNKVIEVIDTPDSPAGKSEIYSDWNLIKKTTSIPAKKGIEFGIEYKVDALSLQSDIEVEEIIIFPGDGITNPKSKTSQKIDSEMILLPSNEKRGFGFKMEYDWEVVPGNWVFQVRHRDVIYAQMVFNVK